MMRICIVSSMFCVFERWATLRQAGGPITLHLSDVLVSDDSMLVLGCVFVSVNVCVWAANWEDLRPIQALLSRCVTVELWFEQRGSNATAWHQVRKDRSAAAKYWLNNWLSIWQRRWRLSNHRKKEIRAALYSATTAVHITRNEEKQRKDKSLRFGKLIYFRKLSRLVSVHLITSYILYPVIIT